MNQKRLTEPVFQYARIDPKIPKGQICVTEYRGFDDGIRRVVETYHNAEELLTHHRQRKRYERMRKKWLKEADEAIARGDTVIYL